MTFAMGGVPHSGPQQEIEVEYVDTEAFSHLFLLSWVQSIIQKANTPGNSMNYMLLKPES